MKVRRVHLNIVYSILQNLFRCMVEDSVYVDIMSCMQLFLSLFIANLACIWSGKYFFYSLSGHKLLVVNLT